MSGKILRGQFRSGRARFVATLAVYDYVCCYPRFFSNDVLVALVWAFDLAKCLRVYNGNFFDMCYYLTVYVPTNTRTVTGWPVDFEFAHDFSCSHRGCMLRITRDMEAFLSWQLLEDAYRKLCIWHRMRCIFWDIESTFSR